MREPQPRTRSMSMMIYGVTSAKGSTRGVKIEIKVRGNHYEDANTGAKDGITRGHTEKV